MESTVVRAHQKGSKDAAAEIRRHADTVRVALAKDVESSNVNMPPVGGDLPGTLVINSLIAEVLGHGWDFTKAAGQI
ncbi:hypothetical protein ACWD4N_02525 [Streptomyces sp. NPDC002586]|uniref:hypothetical protein n=1 Tax=Streptomyces sp. CG4 TaxID=408783 RepID=UPI0034E2DF6F